MARNPGFTSTSLLTTALLCLAGLAVGFDGAAQTAEPDLETYLELVERYRRDGPREVVPLLAGWSLERTRSVLPVLAGDPDPRSFRRNDAAGFSPAKTFGVFVDAFRFVVTDERGDIAPRTRQASDKRADQARP